MTITDLSTSSGSIVGPTGLAAQLAASITAAAAELEEQNDVPAELLAELREAGALRLLTPREFGGLEAPLTTVLQVYEEFGRLDASVAWVVWNANFGFLGALLDEAAGTRIWSAGSGEPVFANSGKPGVAIPVEGGYRLSGHWKIVSGINSATWLVVFAVVQQDGAPRLTEAGGPEVRIFAVPAEQLSIQQSWNVSGMRGSGSNDVLIEDAVVPAAMTVRLDQPSRIDRPLYRGFLPALVLPGCSAIVIGVAQAAIDELVDLARTKTTSTGEAFTDLPRVQATVARAEAALGAARLLLLAAAQTFETANQQNEPITIEQRARLRAAMSHAAQVSREVLVAMYELASSSAIYLGSPLERLFRDGMVALQHINHAAAAFEGVGRVRFGLDPKMSLF